MNDLVDLFTENFTKGNRDKASYLLEKHDAPIRKKDAMLISYFLGLLTMILLGLIIILIIP